MKKKKPQIIISIQGGCVQQVYSTLDAEVLLLDWDACDEKDKKRCDALMRRMTKEKTPCIF